jgi:hypothetical protein
MEAIIARSRSAGMQINVKYGEGFTTTRNLGTADLLSLL